MKDFSHRVKCRRSAIGRRFLTVICVIGTLAQASAAQPPRRERVIQERPGAPIASRLKPTDEIVVIERPEPFGVRFNSPPTLPEQVGHAVFVCDAAVVVTPDRVEPRLSDDGSWVETRIAGVVSDVAMARKRPLKTGQRIEIVDESGGQLTIAKVLVKAGVSPKVDANREYLMFLKENPDTGVLWPCQTALLVEGGILWNPWNRDATERKDPYSGAKVADVKKLIAAELQRIPQ